jgi:hypothetical protein
MQSSTCVQSLCKVSMMLKENCCSNQLYKIGTISVVQTNWQGKRFLDRHSLLVRQVKICDQYVNIKFVYDNYNQVFQYGAVPGTFTHLKW